MDDVIHRRLKNLERDVEHTAPTVPQYDLTISGLTAKIYLDAFGVNLIADTDYTIEIHFTSGGIDYYLNGTLVNSGPSYGSDPTLSVIFLPDSPLDTNPAAFLYMWDFRAGTSRGASDVLSDPLTSIPTVPPWGFVDNVSNSGETGLTTVNLSSVGNVLKCERVFDPIDGDWQFAHNLGVGSDRWLYFKARFPNSLLTELKTTYSSGVIEWLSDLGVPIVQLGAE